MRTALRSVVLACSLLGAGCTDLSDVRDFAKLSAETASYRGIVQTYGEHPARMTRYRPQLQATFEANRVERERQREALIALQDALTEYMASLGKLAADEAVAFQTNPLTQAAAKVGVISTESADAVSAIGNLLLRAAAGAWRQREVSQIIGDANAPLQDVVSTLKKFVGTVAAEDAQERQGIAFFYSRLNLQSTDPAGRQALTEWQEQRDREVAARAASREAFLEAIDAIGRGHQVMYENRNRLSARETIRQIRLVDAELRRAASLLRPLLAI